MKLLVEKVYVYQNQPDLYNQVLDNGKRVLLILPQYGFYKVLCITQTTHYSKFCELNFLAIQIPPKLVDNEGIGSSQVCFQISNS